MSLRPIERRLELAAGFITAGLLVEIAVSAWIHPLAFMIFALLACPLVAAGMLLFLWSLVSAR